MTKFSAPIYLATQQVSVGATMGVSVSPIDGDTADVLLRRADVALYRAKEDGKGRFAFFESGMDARVHERAALERDLRIAVKNDEIVHISSLWCSWKTAWCRATKCSPAGRTQRAG